MQLSKPDLTRSRVGLSTSALDYCESNDNLLIDGVPYLKIVFSYCSTCSIETPGMDIDPPIVES